MVFNRPCRDWIVLVSLPSTACWARLSRPCGTEFANGVLTQALKASASGKRANSAAPYLRLAGGIMLFMRRYSTICP